ncbi:MAG: DMT family transporter [Microthrixaceae bacterium]
MAVLFAFLAAFGFAMASVGQQRVASAVPSRHALRVGLLVQLVANWRWLVATTIDFASFVLEGIALNFGSLVLVQALLPSSLLFALPVSAKLVGRRLSRSEWLGAIGVAAGITMFLVAAAPSEGRSDAPAVTWLVLVGIILSLVVVLVATGLRSSSSALTSGCWATAGAVTYAFMAAATKSLVGLLGDGLGVALSSWQPYAVVLSAVLGTVLIQSAFQAGSLSASMPLMVMIEPISGALIGSIVLQEQINRGPIHIAVMALAMASMLVGVVTLSRSPLARYIA